MARLVRRREVSAREVVSAPKAQIPALSGKYPAETGDEEIQWQRVRYTMKDRKLSRVILHG